MMKKDAINNITKDNITVKIDSCVNEFYYAIEKDYEERIVKNKEETDNSIREKTLEKYFQKSEFKQNTELDNILVKVTLLNSFYSTQIKNIDLVAVARHIYSIENIDQRLEKGEVDLVNEIAYTNDEYNQGMNKIYSFASKYCAWHHPDKFPIVDSYSKGMLYYINKCKNFYNQKLTRNDLNDYETYCAVYNKFIEKFGLQNKSLKHIDIFFWKYGKKNEIRI